MMVADFSSSWTCLAPRQCTAMWAATAALGRTWPRFREKRIPKLPQNTRGNLCGIPILQGWLSIFADEKAWLDNCGSVASKRFGNASLESWSSSISRCRVVCGGFLSAQAVKSRASWRAKCLTILTAKQDVVEASEIWNCNVIYMIWYYIMSRTRCTLNQSWKHINPRVKNMIIWGPLMPVQLWHVLRCLGRSLPHMLRPTTSLSPQ